MDELVETLRALVVVSMRTYDVLMFMFGDQNQELANKLKEFHESGGIVNDTVRYVSDEQASTGDSSGSDQQAQPERAEYDSPTGPV